jgi:hypothetical protein
MTGCCILRPGLLVRHSTRNRGVVLPYPAALHSSRALGPRGDQPNLSESVRVKYNHRGRGFIIALWPHSARTLQVQDYLMADQVCSGLLRQYLHSLLALLAPCA